MNRHGNLHRIMLFVILFAGFGLGLGLPALHRYNDRQHAHLALRTARELARAEQVFYEKHGYYTADFSSLVSSKKCVQSVQQEKSIFACPDYTLSLEEAQLLRAQSNKYPQWFTVSLENGLAKCEYEDGSLVGPQLCRAADL